MLEKIYILYKMMLQFLCARVFLYDEDRSIEVSILCLLVPIDISKFSTRRQKVAYQTVLAVDVGVITRDIGDSGCRLQIVRDTVLNRVGDGLD